MYILPFMPLVFDAYKHAGEDWLATTQASKFGLLHVELSSAYVGMYRPSDTHYSPLDDGALFPPYLFTMISRLPASAAAALLRQLEDAILYMHACLLEAPALSFPNQYSDNSAACNQYGTCSPACMLKFPLLYLSLYACTR
jgi:hypothetical protein